MGLSNCFLTALERFVPQIGHLVIQCLVYLSLSQNRKYCANLSSMTVHPHSRCGGCLHTSPSFTKMLLRQASLPSMLTCTGGFSNLPTKAALVDRLPWLVSKICGLGLQASLPLCPRIHAGRQPPDEDLPAVQVDDRHQKHIADLRQFGVGDVRRPYLAWIHRVRGILPARAHLRHDGQLSHQMHQAPRLFLRQDHAPFRKFPDCLPVAVQRLVQRHIRHRCPTFDR